MPPILVQTLKASIYAPIGTVETEILLKNLSDIYGNVLTTADFNGLMFFTIAPGSRSSQEICSATAIVNMGDGSFKLTGVIRGLQAKYPFTAGGIPSAHGVNEVVVFSDNPQVFQALITYLNGLVVAGAPNASQTVKGIVEIPTSAQINAGTSTGETGAILAISPDQLLLSIFGLQLPTSAQKDALAGAGGTPSSTNKYLTETSRPLTDVQVFSAYAGVFTVTFASPGVFTLANHGFTTGSPVSFSTTGALPTGLTAGIPYYVIAAGLTTNTFQVSTTVGGTALNTSGSQSGTHTAKNVWVKPTGAKSVTIIAVGAGGGGGGGSGSGSSGGGGGAVNLKTFDASDLDANEFVTVGIAGNGGTFGAAGQNATGSSFGTRMFAGGGGGGNVGSNGGGGGGVIGNAALSVGGAPRTLAASNAIGGQGPDGTGRNAEWGGGSGGEASGSTLGGSSIYGGGGGGGGSVSTNPGKDAGTVGSYTSGGGGTGGTTGNPGGPGARNDFLKKGYGGGGGGGGGQGALGGNGGFPGGGGGGGGDTSGVGGSGAGGQVKVITTF